MTPQISLPPGGKVKISLPLAVLLLVGFTGGGAGGYGLLEDFFSVKQDVIMHTKRIEMAEAVAKAQSEEIKEYKKSVNLITQNQLAIIKSLTQINERLEKITRRRR